MLTVLITNGEGQCFQPNREGCSGSLVFVDGTIPLNSEAVNSNEISKEKETIMKVLLIEIIND